MEDLPKILDGYQHYEDIKNMSKFAFKKLVCASVRKFAFNNLIYLKNEKTKSKDIEYTEFMMQEYLKPNQLTYIEACFIFHARSKMIYLRDNYRGQYKERDNYCQSCLDINITENQRHLYFCAALNCREVICTELSYEDLLKNNLVKQIQVSNILYKRMKKREEIIKNRS